MKKSTRLISAILAALLCAASLAACASDIEPPVADVTTETPTTVVPVTDTPAITTDAPATIAPVTDVTTDAPITVVPETTEAQETTYVPATDAPMVSAETLITTEVTVTAEVPATTTLAEQNIPVDTDDSAKQFEYVIDSYGNVTVKKYIGNEKTVIIPDHIDGRPVTKIGYGAFQKNSMLVSVTMPNTVKEIADSAFRYCSSLRSVSFSSVLVKIGDYCFSACYELTDVSLPESLRNIGTGTFQYCYALCSIEIPNGVTKLDETFKSCTNLSKVIIPVSVTEISPTTFSDTKWISDKADGPVVVGDHVFLGYIGNLNDQYVIPKDIKYVSDINLDILDRGYATDIKLVHDTEIHSSAFCDYNGKLTVDMSLDVFENDEKDVLLSNLSLSQLTILNLPQREVQIQNSRIRQLVFAEGITEIRNFDLYLDFDREIDKLVGSGCKLILLPASLTTLSNAKFSNYLNDGIVELNCSAEESRLQRIEFDLYPTKYLEALYEVCGEKLQSVLIKLGYK